MKHIRLAHFSIPFYNGGGLVKYVKDLVNVQSLDGEIEYVCIFMPGDYNLFKKGVSIDLLKYKQIDIFNINNFNPETLLEGTLYPTEDIENTLLENSIINKLIELNINLVHFHTFFGVSSNLIKKINEKNIKIVYTAHDHQPLCNKTTLINLKGEMCKNAKSTNCSECNSNALTRRKLVLRYSKISNKLKKFSKLKSKIKSIVVRHEIKDKMSDYSNISSELYKKRRDSFIENLNKYCDLIIYSSETTKRIYEVFGVKNNNSAIITASNSNLTCDIKNYVVNIKDSRLKFGYLGGNRLEKGYLEMINSFSKLYDNGFGNWELLILGQGAENIKIPTSIKNNVIIKGELKENLYEDFNILIVPSICPETFNFVVIEGLQNKKLVIASDIVGSADLYKDSGIILYSNNQELGLYYKIKEVIMNKNKVYKVDVEKKPYTKNLKFENHYNQIKDIYMRLLKVNFGGYEHDTKRINSIELQRL